LHTGERISVGDLIKGAMIQSANDAADALALAAGRGSTERFVAWMCGLEHVRETIPYARMLYRTRP